MKNIDRQQSLFFKDIFMNFSWHLNESYIHRTQKDIHAYHMHHIWYHPYQDDVFKWKHFPRYWPFVWGIVNSPTKASDAKLWCFLWSVREITKSSSTFSATNISSNIERLLQLQDTIQTKSHFGTELSSIYLAKWEKRLVFRLLFVNLQRAKDGTHMFHAKYNYMFVV